MSPIAGSQIGRGDNTPHTNLSFAYKAEENKIELLEENDFYLLYEIKKVEKILPSIESTNFISNVKEIMVNKSKNDFNYELIKKISQERIVIEN